MYLLLTADYSAIADYAALGLIVIFALWGLMRGFTKTFFSVFGTMLGLLFAVLLSASATNFLESKFSLVSNAGEWLEGFLNGIIGEDVMSATLEQATQERLSQAGVAQFLVDIIVSAKNDGSLPMNTTLNQIICPTFGYYLVQIGAVVVLFIIFKLIFFLISEIVKKLYKFKPIAWIDKLLGLALGVLHGIINIELIIMVISILPIEICQNVYLGIQTSNIAGFIEKINLYGLITSAISNSNITEFLTKSIQT